MTSSAVALAAERLDRDGFVVLPRLCDGRFVERIFETAKRRADEVRNALGEKEIGIGSAAGYLEIVQRSPGRWDVPISSDEFSIEDRDMPWWPLVETVLGEDAEHSFSGVVFSEPGSPAQFWHCDSPHIDTRHLPPHALNVLVALHEIPMEMGPTECARASHRLTNHLRNPSLVREKLIYQHATTTPDMLVENAGEPAPERVASALDAGSCLVIDDRLMHRGLANRSERVRHIAYFSYRKRDYTENTHFEAQRSVFETGG